MLTFYGAFWSLGSRGLALRGLSSLQCLAGVTRAPEVGPGPGQASRGHVRVLVARYVIGSAGVASGGCGSLMLAGSCCSAGASMS